MVVQADVSKEDEVQHLVDEIKSRHGKLDILINNAGIYDPEDGVFSAEVFESVFRINFMSAVLVSKYATDIMEQGRIVNVSSIHGELGGGAPRVAAYSAMKAALESYTKNLARELAPNILVNAVAPGRTATPMWGSPNEEEKIALGQEKLIKRMIEPEEIADAILFLVKNDAMAGEIIRVSGGK